MTKGDEEEVHRHLGGRGEMQILMTSQQQDYQGLVYNNGKAGGYHHQVQLVDS